MAQEVEIMAKGTIMTGQVMGLTLHPTPNPQITPPPTLQSRLEAETETGLSGTETTGRDGFDRQLVCSLSPHFLCCLCLLWSLLPPCGDSWILKCGSEGKISVMLESKAHY